MMTISRDTNTIQARKRLLTTMLAATAVFLLALVAPVAAHAGQGQGGPDLGACQNLQAPAGNKVAATLYAEGVQIYRWNGTSWAFVAPEAVLYPNGSAAGVVGTHYAGPTWQSNSGSNVVGAVVDRCTADPTAIPWLLLRAISSVGPGIFHGVTFIQRVNTVGGLAPSAPGGVVGEEARVPYTAEYVFYRAHK